MVVPFSLSWSVTSSSLAEVKMVALGNHSHTCSILQLVELIYIHNSFNIQSNNGVFFCCHVIVGDPEVQGVYVIECHTIN